MGRYDDLKVHGPDTNERAPRALALAGRELVACEAVAWLRRYRKSWPWTGPVPSGEAQKLRQPTAVGRECATSASTPPDARPPLGVPRRGAASRARRGFAAAVLLAALTSLTLALVAVPVGVAAPPADFQTSLVIGDGLDGPSGFEIAPDGRIFILERSGKIKIVKDGELLPTPFADLPSENTGDRGLIGIAFDPEFGQTNHYVYFYYTGHDLLNHLVRFSADQDVATNGPIELFRTSSPSHELHVGGSIRFGPDGKLYFAVGDNGNGFLAQDLSNPHGKILRINKDGSIPADNPFADQPGKLGAIWAYGFRNPWRFQFDSATGRLYVGDVGDFTWEEVNRVVKGGNYGWPVHEGICTSGCAGYIDPLYVYPHAGESAAVTGGPVYRGADVPARVPGRPVLRRLRQGVHPERRPRLERRHHRSPRLRRPGGQRRRSEGRSRRLALLHHLLPGRAVPHHLQLDRRICPWPAPPPTSPRGSSRSPCTSPAPAAGIPTATH